MVSMKNVNVNENVFKGFVQYQKDLFNEMGFDSFTPSAAEEVISEFVNYRYFQSLMYEIIYDEQEWYDEEQWQDLCEYYGCDTNEDAARMELNNYMENEDAIDWYRNRYGENEFFRAVQENDLLDFNGMSEWLIKHDGLEYYMEEQYKFYKNI